MTNSTRPVRLPAGRVPFDAIRAPTLAALTQLFSLCGGLDRCLVIDLSLGAWRAHEAARQLCDQLGRTLELPRYRPAAPAPDAGKFGVTPRYVEQISAGIDAEAGGDLGVRAAVQLTAQIVSTLGPSARAVTVLVLLPRRGACWEDEDAALVRSLAARLCRAGGALRLVATEDGPPVLPPSWHAVWRDSGGISPALVPSTPTLPSPADDDALLGLVPGLLEPMLVLALRADAARLADLPRLRGQRLVVPPEWRPGAERVPPSAYDRLAHRARGVPWLDAYAQAQGSTSSADPELLYAQAQVAFGEGGGGVGVRFARQAVAAARGELEQAALRAALDSMRIALFRYAEVAEAPEVSPGLPAPLRGFLLQTKGWALVMSSDPQRAAHAEPYLAQARDLLANSADEREYLYLLNISALARMKAGHLDQALAWEDEIAERASRLVPRDYRLEYVNAVNQARLYRRLADYPAAEHCYRRAFATVDGTRSESDALHANVCLGRIAAEVGDLAEAYRCWLRVALHWLSAQVPEGLAWRVVLAILGRRPASHEDLVDVMGGALVQKLTALAAQAGRGEAVDVADRESGAEPPWFARCDGPPGGVPLSWGAAGHGWSVFGTDETPPTALAAGAQDTPNQRRLRRFVSALLSTECSYDGLAQAELLLVYDNYGREMPVGFAELVSACALGGVTVLATRERIMRLSAEVVADLRAQARVRIGPAVHRFEPCGAGAVVHFRRYRSSMELTADQFRAVALVQENPRLLDRHISALVAARVLIVDLPEEICSAVGTRPPSSMNCRRS